MKENNKKLFLILIIIINIILLLILLLLFNQKSNSNSNNTVSIETKYNDVNSPNTIANENTIVSEDKRFDIIYPMRVSEFSEKYQGQMSDEFILNKITSLIYYIKDNKELIDNLDNNKIIEYYNNNKKELNDIGIDNEKVYQNLISEIKKLPTKELSLSYADFIMDTMKINEQSTSIDLQIKFANYNPITLNLIIDNYYKKDAILFRINI